MTLTIARKPYSWPEIPRTINISLDSAVAYAAQYAPHGQCDDMPQRITGPFDLRILNSSVAFNMMLMKSLRNDRPDMVLTIGMDYDETPPKLLINAYEHGQNEGMGRMDMFKLCRAFKEGERRLLGGGVHLLEVAARYVLIGGELMWDLEIGRPGVSPRLEIERSTQPGLEHIEGGVDPSRLMPQTSQRTMHAGYQGMHSPAIPSFGPPRPAAINLPMLNTNLPPHLNNPGLERVSPIPATSIATDQYWKQQQFLAELYLAHIQKQGQTLQQDLIQDGRRSRVDAGHQSKLRKTRLVRFMHDRVHRLFQSHPATRSDEELASKLSTDEELSGNSPQHKPELDGTRPILELCANTIHHELSQNSARHEPPTFSTTHELPADTTTLTSAVQSYHELPAFPVARIESEVYELDSTPIENCNITRTDFFERRETEFTERDPPDFSSLTRRFSFSQDDPVRTLHLQENISVEEAVVPSFDSRTNDREDFDEENLEVSARLVTPWMLPHFPIPQFVSAR